jgi:hypothetical protein
MNAEEESLRLLNHTRLRPLVSEDELRTYSFWWIRTSSSWMLAPELILFNAMDH